MTTLENFNDIQHLEDYEKRMLNEFYSIIENSENKNEIWAYFKNKETREGGYFANSHPEYITDIDKKSKMGHSGASFACCCRTMEFIAVNGWDIQEKNNREV